MNSLSKVILLVTLLTVPFAGFAMDDYLNCDTYGTQGKAVETSAQGFWSIVSGARKAAMNNPWITLGVVGTTAVTLYTMKNGYNWMFGKSAGSVAKDAPQGVTVTSGTAAPSNPAGKRNTQATQHQNHAQQPVAQAQKQTPAAPAKTEAKDEESAPASSGWFSFGGATVEDVEIDIATLSQSKRAKIITVAKIAKDDAAFRKAILPITGISLDAAKAYKA